MAPASLRWCAPLPGAGRAIGYIEINGHLDVLADIFMLHNAEGLMVQALYDDGSEFFPLYGR